MFDQNWLTNVEGVVLVQADNTILYVYTELDSKKRVTRILSDL